MANENAKTVLKTLTDGVVGIAAIGTIGILGYEMITRITGGTSLIGTIIRTRSMKSVIRSMRNNIPKEQWTEDTINEINDAVNSRVEDVE